MGLTPSGRAAAANATIRTTDCLGVTSGCTTPDQCCDSHHDDDNPNHASTTNSDITAPDVKRLYASENAPDDVYAGRTTRIDENPVPGN
jgi:hypothetical protein